MVSSKSTEPKTKVTTDCDNILFYQSQNLTEVSIGQQWPGWTDGMLFFARLIRWGSFQKVEVES